MKVTAIVLGVFLLLLFASSSIQTISLTIPVLNFPVSFPNPISLFWSVTLFTLLGTAVTISSMLLLLAFAALIVGFVR